MWSGLLEHPSVDGEANRYLDLDPLLAGVGLVLCTVIESTTVTLLSFGPPLSLCLGRNLNRHRSNTGRLLIAQDGTSQSPCCLPLSLLILSCIRLFQRKMYGLISTKLYGWSYLH
ncbi:uncharacterized protein [Triticum aestivum]|uniref:uncharacterized protein isoform X1 n=1 Tax=Triticum aestivum TaxID=4565 RepID=UPI001D0190BF|nr:uncharacterized protein LOC123135261 isoform X1 [Triticum aestivum]